MNESTLGGLPILDPPERYLGHSVNSFTMHSGAARIGVGNFLLSRKDYNKLIADSVDSGDTSATLILTSDTTKLKVQMLVELAGAMPFSAAMGTHYEADQDSDVLEVFVFDERSRLFGPVEKAYNVQKAGFTYNADTGKPDFYASTLISTDTPWKWTSVITDLIPGIDRDFFPNAPTWQPRNLIFDQLHFARAVDDIAARIFFVVGFDWTKQGTASLRMFKPGEAWNSNLAMEGVQDAWIGGHRADPNRDRLPGKFRCVFKAADQDNPDDPFATRSYTKDITDPGGFGDPSYTQVLHIGEYVAVRSSGAWKEQAILDAVAADMAKRAFRALQAPIEEVTFAGIWPFKPDGLIRGIRWTSDRKGARTTVRYNNDRDFSPMDEARRATLTATNQLLLPLGNANVSQSQSGAKYFWAQGGGKGGVFPVVLKNPQGTNPGDSPAAINYDVYDLDGATLLEANVPLALPRPAFKIILQNQNPNYGLASTIDGHIKLWEAGEVISAGDCVTP
jgi:hypothetical protein